VNGLVRKNDQLVLQTRSGRELVVDGVVAGVGIQPNTELAEKAGLKVDNGIVVDETLRAGWTDIFAAGDVANFYNPLLDKRMRVEHEDNANAMGEAAGRNMALAEPEPYHHLPFFFSDLFELGYEAIGDTRPHLNIIADWQQKFSKGVVYYLDQGRVRGVLLWNVWNQVDAARKLIGEPGPFDIASLKSRLPEKVMLAK
jgi:3-phenylpropionate/trans-cinnamate dioxygenase ferredoxin reductase subunit